MSFRANIRRARTAAALDAACTAAKQGGVSDAAIAKARAMNPHVKRAKAQPLAQPPVAYATATPAVPKARKAKRAKPALKQAKALGEQQVTLTKADGTQLTGTCTVWPARKALRGSGKTHDVLLTVEGKAQRGTMSPEALERFQSGKGTRLGFGAALWLVQPVAQQ